MSTAFTIRKLDEKFKHKLRLRAARHQTSMEAEARAIFALAVDETNAVLSPPRTPGKMRERLASVRGLWKERADGRTTDEIMQELRGDD